MLIALLISLGCNLFNIIMSLFIMSNLKKQIKLDEIVNENHKKMLEDIKKC